MAYKKRLKDTYSYKGWITSDSFLKRSFAICGYSMVPVLIFYGAVLGIILILMILIWIFRTF